MSWKDDVVSELGVSMGMEQLDFGESNVLSLTFEESGTLHMENQDEGVLLYLFQKIPAHDQLILLMRALKQCHYQVSQRFLLQTGLNEDDELFFCVFLDNEDFSRPHVESTIQYLMDQFRLLLAD
ncbi:hypothetical protein CI610_01268 [invertebrate metagenome]|uniref:Type III secretion chaperone SycN n=1 Tax=invertebrate metagenome TaxID=1711999 RepID=A0A2H9T957_9ZZZZ